MLHHLRTHNAVEFTIRSRGKIIKKVGYLGLKTLAAAPRDRFLAQVDPARRNADLAERLEKLAPPAADVENVGTSFEERLVEFLMTADILFRPPKFLGKLPVIETR